MNERDESVSAVAGVVGWAFGVIVFAWLFAALGRLLPTDLVWWVLPAGLTLITVSAIVGAVAGFALAALVRKWFG